MCDRKGRQAGRERERESEKQSSTYTITASAPSPKTCELLTKRSSLESIIFLNVNRPNTVH